MQSFTPYNPNFSGNRWKSNIAATTWGAGLVLPRFLPRCLVQMFGALPDVQPQKNQQCRHRKDLSYWPWPSLDHPPGVLLSPQPSLELLHQPLGSGDGWEWLSDSVGIFWNTKSTVTVPKGLGPVIARNSIQIEIISIFLNTLFETSKVHPIYLSQYHHRLV